MTVVRSVLAVILAFVLVVVSVVAEAQQAGKVYRVGILDLGPLPELEKALGDGLRDAGYAENSITIIKQYPRAGSAPLADRLLPAAEDLVAANPDVIVTIATPAGLAASRTTKTVPIVAVSTDPVKSGLVSSLARPGGNVTGVVVMGPELTGKRLELLAQVAPSVRRVYFPYGRGGMADSVSAPILTAYMREHQVAAKRLGMKVESLEMGPFDPDEWDRVLASLGRDHSSAISVHDSPTYIQRRATIAKLALKYRVPTVFSFAEAVRAGGLISFGVNLSDIVRHAALAVDKILKGARPADVPVEQPTKFELVINLKTAKALALTIPPSLLLRADQVIE